MCRSPLGTGPHHPAVGNDLSPETIGSALSGHGPSASMSPQATYPIFLSGTSAADPLLRNPNRRHGLLRARRERPRRRAAEQRDEVASLHVGHGPSSRRSPYRSRRALARRATPGALFRPDAPPTQNASTA